MLDNTLISVRSMTYPSTFSFFLFVVVVDFNHLFPKIYLQGGTVSIRGTGENAILYMLCYITTSGIFQCVKC
jgi:hypothetical protein